MVSEDCSMCLKHKKTDDGFDGRKNNYIEYISEEDEYKNLS